MKGVLRLGGLLEPGDHRRAGGHAERAGHEIEILHRDGDRRAVELAGRDQHGVFHAGLDARFLEPVDVALLVAEFQRILRHRRQRHGLVFAVVEEGRHAVVGLDLHVVAGARHHPLVGLEIAVKHHLARLGVLDPEVLRRLALVQKRPDFRGEDVVDPAHGDSLRGNHAARSMGCDCGEYRRARSNAQTVRLRPQAARSSASARPRPLHAGRRARLTSVVTAATVPAVALPSTSEPATALQSAVPTTTPSASRPIAAASSAVLMPKPTATGRSVWLLMRLTASPTAA